MEICILESNNRAFPGYSGEAHNKKNMIKWLKKKFGITELIDEQKKTNDLLLKILSESGKTANSVRAYNRAYHIQD